MVRNQSNSFKLDQAGKLNQGMESLSSSIGSADVGSSPPNLEPDLSVLINRKTRKRKTLQWFLLTLGICGTVGGIGGFAFWFLTTPPPSPDCQKISTLSTDMDRLQCAQSSAQTGDLSKILAAMELLGQWTPDHPLYREAQRLIAEWSGPVLAAARDKLEQSDLRGAIELASRIPKTSPVYKDAQTSISRWKQYWQKGEAIATAARKAMKEQNWTLAEEKIAVLREFHYDYWRSDRATALSQMVTAEKKGRQLFAQATATAKPGTPAQLGAAIALVSRMDSKTFAWTDAQVSQNQWGEKLLALGYQNWLKGNLDEAMNLATPVLQDSSMAQTAQELLWLSQARKHALGGATTLKPTFPQLWNLSAAIATASQIQPASRYYAQAQANLKNWQAQFQDLTLLQTAWIVGETPFPAMKKLAIAQANQVVGDRPRRAQAQTLVAYWDQEIRRLEDTPYLMSAQAIAGKGTIPYLQAAIAQAKLITAKRPSYKEAQTLIAGWTAQIQTIEDQPILNRAWALVNQGQLNQAILVAETLHPGRALYGQAQSAIATWQAQLLAAELARQRAAKEALERAQAKPSSTNDERSPEAAPSPSEQSSPEAFPSPEGIHPSQPPTNHSPAPTTRPGYPPASYPPASYPPASSPPTSHPPGNEPPPPPQTVVPSSPIYIPYEPVPPSRP